MTTIIIADGITATMTLAKVEQYHKIMEATAFARAAMLSGDEHLDRTDIEDLWTEEWEAWNRFFS